MISRIPRVEYMRPIPIEICSLFSIVATTVFAPDITPAIDSPVKPHPICKRRLLECNRNSSCPHTPNRLKITRQRKQLTPLNCLAIPGSNRPTNPHPEMIGKARSDSTCERPFQLRMSRMIALNPSKEAFENPTPKAVSIKGGRMTLCMSAFNCFNSVQKVDKQFCDFRSVCVLVSTFSIEVGLLLFFFFRASHGMENNMAIGKQFK